MVVLRRQAEAGDGAVRVLLADGRVLHEVADREVLPFDPDGGCLSEIFVDNDSGVGDNSGFGLSICQGLEKGKRSVRFNTYRIMFLVDRPSPSLVLTDEEFLEVLPGQLVSVYRQRKQSCTYGVRGDV